MTITADQSAAYYEARGYAREQDVGDDVDRCSHCADPTLADELVALDGQDVCLPCLTALTGDDMYGPDNARDL